MTPDRLLEHKARIDEEYRNLVEQDRLLQGQIQALSEQRSEIAKRCLNLQGQAQLIEQFLAAADSPPEGESAEPLALVR